MGDQSRLLISASQFSSTYHGHAPPLLRSLESSLRSLTIAPAAAADTTLPPTPLQRRAIWLAGDSSLDNKAWVPPLGALAVNGYEHCLSPPRVPQDIAYCVNSELVARGATSYVCINAAVEESTLGARHGGRLLPQDEVIRERLQSDDVLIVSVGGNDVALRPGVCTVLSMLALTWCASDRAIADGTAFGYSHFEHLFGAQVQAYVESLCGAHRPRTVLLCMIYFPHEKRGGWPDAVLDALGYNSPKGIARLQAVIRRLFHVATARIVIHGVERVIALPLFDVLSSAEGSDDYVARVEPSVAGGRKMAAAFVDAILR